MATTPPRGMHTWFTDCEQLAKVEIEENDDKATATFPAGTEFLIKRNGSWFVDLDSGVPPEKVDSTIKSAKKMTEALIPARANIGKPGYTAQSILEEMRRATSSSLERKGELTRELAAAILNEYLAKAPTVSELKFQEDGIDRAVADGIIKDCSHSGDFPGGPHYGFSEKGLIIVGRFIAGDANTNRFGGAPGFRVITFQLKAPISETIAEVTGITVGGPMPRVEYRTSYAFPSEMTPIKKYVYSGAMMAAVFRKYDDGWRLCD